MPASKSTVSSSNDPATVIAVGVLAATVATVGHETLGHSLGCFAAGGHVNLLTSIWFQCSNRPVLADAGGPIGNLVAGSLALMLLRYTRPHPTMGLFLLLLGALSLFWLAAQLVFESVSHRRDDWYWALQMGWRPVAAVVGIGGYLLVRRWLAAINRKGGGATARAILLGYAAAAASGITAGLMWRPEPFRSALEEFMVLGLAPLGLLTVARKASQDIGDDSGVGSVPRSWTWIAVCTVIFGLYLFIQARGLGPMATSRLPG